MLIPCSIIPAQGSDSMMITSVEVHPLLSVIVTVYEPAEDTEIGLPVAQLSQEYVDPGVPVAVI